MSEAPILAISGTPGVGKTKLCSFLNLSGFTVVDLKELAQTHGCLGEEDPKDGAAPIDIHALADAWNPDENEKIAIDGPFIKKQMAKGAQYCPVEIKNHVLLIKHHSPLLTLI